MHTFPGDSEGLDRAIGERFELAHTELRWPTIENVRKPGRYQAHRREQALNIVTEGSNTTRKTPTTKKFWKERANLPSNLFLCSVFRNFPCTDAIENELSLTLQIRRRRVKGNPAKISSVTRLGMFLTSIQS